MSRFSVIHKVGGVLFPWTQCLNLFPCCLILNWYVNYNLWHIPTQITHSCTPLKFQSGCTLSTLSTAAKLLYHITLYSFRNVCVFLPKQTIKTTLRFNLKKINYPHIVQLTHWLESIILGLLSLRYNIFTWAFVIDIVCHKSHKIPFSQWTFWLNIARKPQENHKKPNNISVATGVSKEHRCG